MRKLNKNKSTERGLCHVSLFLKIPTIEVITSLCINSKIIWREKRTVRREKERKKERHRERERERERKKERKNHKKTERKQHARFGAARPPTIVRHSTAFGDPTPAFEQLSLYPCVFLLCVFPRRFLSFFAEEFFEVMLEWLWIWVSEQTWKKTKHTHTNGYCNQYHRKWANTCA